MPYSHHSKSQDSSDIATKITVKKSETEVKLHVTVYIKQYETESKIAV